MKYRNQSIVVHDEKYCWSIKSVRGYSVIVRKHDDIEMLKKEIDLLLDNEWNVDVFVIDNKVDRILLDEDELDDSTNPNMMKGCIDRYYSNNGLTTFLYGKAKSFEHCPEFVVNLTIDGESEDDCRSAYCTNDVFLDTTKNKRLVSKVIEVDKEIASLLDKMTALVLERRDLLLSIETIEDAIYSGEIFNNNVEDNNK